MCVCWGVGGWDGAKKLGVLEQEEQAPEVGLALQPSIPATHPCTPSSPPPPREREREGEKETEKPKVK